MYGIRSKTGQRLLIRCIQTCQYVFLILLSGLVGAYAGNLIDPFIGSTPNVARQWGWIIGAVLAAVGAPLGWVTLGANRKSRRRIFSLPIGNSRARNSKSKTRRTAAGRLARPVSTLKAAGWGTVFGLLLGGIVGGALLMAWFSIAMSPFAPSEVNRSVRMDTEERSRVVHRETRRTSLTTNHPVPISLFFGAVTVLGVAGTITGAVFGFHGKATESD